MPPRTPDEMREAIFRNLPEKTGKSHEEWSRLLRTQGPESVRKERIAWLQRQGLGHGQAAMVVDWTDRPEVFDERDAGELVEAQLAGKDAIRPVFARLSSLIEELGDDIAREPRQTYVAFSRGRQFALMQPSTATRLDVGLVLDGVAETDRLRPAGSFGSGRITHRVSLAHEDEIDAELTDWLRAAYDAARR
jgi:predicted transport protein